MSNRHKQLAEQLLSVRPTTRDLVTSILIDAWPRHAAIVDFGIDSQKHYEALYYPIREADLLPKELDNALGDGPKLTAMSVKPSIFYGFTRVTCATSESHFAWVTRQVKSVSTFTNLGASLLLLLRGIFHWQFWPVRWPQLWLLATPLL